MAALTRSGARKASEIVMLTFRTLHPSRSAMLSVFAAGSVMSSLSQRRPRAIDATRSRAVLGSDWAGILMWRRLGHENLAASGGWCLAPRHFDHVAVLSLPL